MKNDGFMREVTDSIFNPTQKDMIIRAVMFNCTFMIIPLINPMYGTSLSTF